MSMKRKQPPEWHLHRPDCNTFWRVLQEFKNSLGGQNDLHPQMDTMYVVFSLWHTVCARAIFLTHSHNMRA